MFIAVFLKILGRVFVCFLVLSLLPKLAIRSLVVLSLMIFFLNAFLTFGTIRNFSILLAINPLLLLRLPISKMRIIPINGCLFLLVFRFLAISIYKSIKGGIAMIVATSAPTMSSLLTDLSTVATQVFSWVGDVAAEITTQPILLLTTGFLVVGE